MDSSIRNKCLGQISLLALALVCACNDTDVTEHVTNDPKYDQQDEITPPTGGPAWGDVLCLTESDYPYCFAQGAAGLAVTLAPNVMHSPAWVSENKKLDVSLECKADLNPHEWLVECWQPDGTDDVRCFGKSHDPALPSGVWFPVVCDDDDPWWLDLAPISNACDPSHEAAKLQSDWIACNDAWQTCREYVAALWVHTIPACSLADLDVVPTTDFAD